MARTIVIGLGGMGQSIARRVNARFAAVGKADKVGAFALDFVIEDPHLGPVELFRNLDVRDARRLIAGEWKSGWIEEWWPRLKGSCYLPPGDLSSSSAGRQQRLSGLLAFTCNEKAIRQALQSFLSKHFALDAPDGGLPKKNDARVYIVSSLGGGTGAGLLVPVTFLVRDLIGTEATVAAVLLDGTITSIHAPDTGPMAYAALVEVEHWMREPASYHHRPMDPEGVEIQKIERFLDVAHVVQMETEDGLILSGRRTGKRKDDYCDLVANWLCMSVGLEGHFAENIEVIFRNLGQGVNTKGRAFSYGRIGASRLAFPFQRASRYVAACETAAFFDELATPSHAEGGADSVLAEVGVPDGVRSLFDELENGSDSWKAYNARYKKVCENLEKRANSPAKARGYLRDAGLEDSLAEMTGAGDKLTQQFRVVADMTIGGILESGRKRVSQDIAALRVATCKDWLKQLRVQVVKVKEDLKTHVGEPQASLSAFRVNVTKSRAAMFGGRKYLFWGTFDGHRDRFVRDLKRYWQALVAIAQYSALTPALESLAEGIERLEAMVDEVRDALKLVGDEAALIRGSFAPRGLVVDERQSEQKEYALEMQIGNTWGIVEQIQKHLQQHLFNDETFRNERLLRIRDGAEVHFGDDGGTEEWGGLKAWIEDRIGREEQRTRREARQRADRVQNLAAMLGAVLKDHGENETRKMMETDFPLDHLLDLYLGEIYSRFVKDPDDPNRARKVLEGEFGVEGMKELGSCRELGDWKKKALEAYCKQMLRMSGRFAKLSARRNHFFKALWPGGSPSEIRKISNILRVLHPVDFGFAHAVRDAVGGDDKMVSGTQLTPYAIEYFFLDGGYPLFALEEIGPYHDAYVAHRNHYEQGTYLHPYHSDHRFYTIWKDDLVSEDRQDTWAFRLYLLGLGTDVIEYVQGKGLIVPGTRLKVRNLQQFTKWLRETREAPRRIASMILAKHEFAHAFSAAALGDTSAQQMIIDAFVKAAQEHANLRPGGRKDTDAFQLWEEIRGLGAAEQGEGNLLIRGPLVPALGDEQAFGALKTQLESAFRG